MAGRPTDRAGQVSGASEPEPSQGIPVRTPMMAIPATRTVPSRPKRGSAAFDVDGDEPPSRPGSSRSVRTGGLRPLSFNHKRHRSKPFHTRSFRIIYEDRAPFHRNAADDSQAESRLPAFHNDNIIDPELAPYLSDEGSSADEQMSFSAAMNGDIAFSGHGDSEKGNLSLLLGSAKRSRLRLDDPSIGAASTTSRDQEDYSGAGPRGVHGQRLKAAYGTSPTHHRLLPKVPKGSHLLRTIGSALPDVLGNFTASPSPPSEPRPSRTRMTKSTSLRGASAPAVELNNASLQHVRCLLNQLLRDANIANSSAWENALMPILLQCTDDVNPEVRHGDDMDIRHYVKVKRIPGGAPGDTSYISGVVFTKNLALKSMPRSISRPRIVIVTFPIEYHRHQQHFMSLGPVIAQEKEYLANLVKRIVALRPQFLLVQRNVSGLALQYLAEANVATAFNVKPAVLEAVSRCVQTEILSSVDMLVLKSIHVGGCEALDVKTYVNKDIPAKKKTFIFLSGCPPSLGCTIVLRGGNMNTLAQIKHITEFMVYVVYNLKLETCLMRDEFALIPSVTEGGTLSHANKTVAGVDESAERCRLVEVPASVEGADIEPKGEVRRSMEIEKPSNAPDASKVVDDAPVPSFYGDMVEKHRTRILSASPFVKFMQPYLLKCAREQESRLVCLKRLLEQDLKYMQISEEQSAPQKFSLVTPEMVHQVIQGAPKKVMEVLHAVHDAEYDKALYHYETQKRQWEIYISGNMDLFDPFAHQNIVLLYSLVCTATTTPCAGPDLLALAYYNEHATVADFTPDCTLGQFVEDLCLVAYEQCAAISCGRRMLDHHRSYVHGEARISIFVQEYPCRISGLQDSILMWSCCKVCKKETQVMPMSENTWKYSLGKYLELSFWSHNLRPKAGVCPHDLHRDYMRYFGYKDLALRVDYDTIDLLEIVVPRARITWNVENDLRVKNDIYCKAEDRINRFMTSVKARLKAINGNTIVSEKAEAFKIEVDKLIKRANEDHVLLIRKLQKQYMNSKYYEVTLLNRATRALQKKVTEWDTAFADFEANFFPSETDITRLAVVQMKRMFLDRDNGSTTSASTAEDGASTHTVESEEHKAPAAGSEASLPKLSEKAELGDEGTTSAAEADQSQPSETTNVPPESAGVNEPSLDGQGPLSQKSEAETQLESSDKDPAQHLDLAVPLSQSELCSSLQSHNVPPAADPASTMAIVKEELRAATMPMGEVKPNIERQIMSQRRFSVKASGIPRPIQGYRTHKLGSSPPLVRARSHPTRPDDFPGTMTSKPPAGANAQTSPAELSRRPEDRLQGRKQPGEVTVPAAPSPGSSTIIKRPGRSSIPRSVHSKKNSSQVSALARHFEQLSREFERERLREKRRRAASNNRAAVHLITSSKPIVEVYQNVLEAVGEQEQFDQEAPAPAQAESSAAESATVTESTPEESTPATSTMESSMQSTEEPEKQAESMEEPKEQASTSSIHGTMDEERSDDGNLDENPDDLHLPSVDEGSDTFSHLDARTGLPKPERSSLVKMLTNFWAERSSSGWAPLDYPM